MPKFQARSKIVTKAGHYDKPIRIQKFTGVQDGIGTTTEPWIDYISTFAHITSKKGDKLVQADQVYPTKRTTFYIRYRPSDSIDATMRILYRDQIYKIIYVIVAEEAQTDTEIYAEEQQAKGSL